MLSDDSSLGLYRFTQAGPYTEDTGCLSIELYLEDGNYDIALASLTDLLGSFCADDSNTLDLQYAIYRPGVWDCSFAVYRIDIVYPSHIMLPQISALNLTCAFDETDEGMTQSTKQDSALYQEYLEYACTGIGYIIRN